MGIFFEANRFNVGVKPYNSPQNKDIYQLSCYVFHEYLKKKKEKLQKGTTKEDLI